MEVRVLKMEVRLLKMEVRRLGLLLVRSLGNEDCGF